ncbi:hypothetical protein QM012_000124 [Aureobasidium pullulans]|uniref:Peptidase A1 domain-containing protein n=1 Tax=Aureobasidium pullulans TaxID=5580 RepID=A0ABR0TUQ9_AURPU
MHFSQIFTASTALYSLCLAHPLTTADIQGKATFTLDQILHTNTTAKHPAQKLLNVYAKYAKAGASAPTVVQKAAASAMASGSVANSPEPSDVMYLCPVNVGGTTLNLDFDTGSSDLWVYSNLQPAAQRSGHSYYTANNAKVMSGSSFNIVYGDGSGASGKVYADKVVVGGVTATAQAVEAATSVSSGLLSNVDSDGFLGLAMSSLNTVSPNKQTTFFDTVRPHLAKAVFTADLKHNAPGSYGFGYIDSSKYTGSITYINLNTNNNGFWQFNTGGYSIGSSAKVSKTISCIADTGTTLMLLPSDVVSAYYAQVKGSTYSSYEGAWIFPCNAAMPTFNTIINGNKFSVPGSYINFANLGNNWCYGGLQADTGIGFCILGDIFMKSQFVVFSQVGSTPQLGFAAKKL